MSSSSRAQLTEGHLNLLEEVYRVLRDHGKWPTFGYLERFLDTRFDTDIEELMETLPHRLTTLPPGRYPVGEQWEVKLTIEGLRYVELPGAAEDVGLFFRVFRQMVVQKKSIDFTVEAQPKPCLTTDGLSAEWRIDKAALHRVFQIVAAQPEPWMGDFTPIGVDGLNLRICASRVLRKFQDAKTLDAYLDLRGAFFAPSPRPQPFVTVPGSPLLRANVGPGVVPSEKDWDAFICHASADKESFVHGLADALKKAGPDIWYDDFELTVGDSLRRKIDQGLARSDYGIVVLSRNFFEREWPQWELDGLTQKQNSEGRKVILPVLHNIKIGEVRKRSLPLADLVAVSSAEGIDRVVEELLKAMKFPPPQNAISNDQAGLVSRPREMPKRMWIGDESLELRVLRVIEELLRDRLPDQRHVDTNMVVQRMGLSAEATAEVAQAMSQLLEDGDVRGKELRGDNQALDLTVTAITEQGSELLEQ
jgi:TIR domain